jgi:stage II sporulation protein M
MTGLFYFAFLENPDMMQEVMGSIVQKLQDEGIFGLRGEFSLLLVLKIFYLNLRSTAAFTLLGFAPFLLGAILFLTMLPVLMGVSLAVTVTKGFDFLTFFKLTAPHGIFELCAVFYGVSLGVYLSKEITKKLFSRASMPPTPLSSMTKQILKSYVLIVIPLLALAAVIEVYFTPLLK